MNGKSRAGPETPCLTLHLETDWLNFRLADQPMSRQSKDRLTPPPTASLDTRLAPLLGMRER